jgi:hypothetical protein
VSQSNENVAQVSQSNENVAQVSQSKEGRRHLVEKLFRSALRNWSVALDVVPQLTTSGVLNHHVDMGSSVDRLVHAKDVT